MRTFLGKHLNTLIGLGLALLTLGVFLRVTGYQFLGYDDGVYVAENPMVLGGLNSQSLAWAFTTFGAGNWHPLTWISLMLDATIFGQSPFGFHLTNLILHIASVLLLFILLNRLTGRVWRSAFVAALFAIHPLHVESVAWIAERKDVLSTLFGLLAVIAYVRYVRRPSAAWYIGMTLLFALSLMAKPMLVTLPILLLLLDYWPLQRFDAKKDGSAARLVYEKAPLLLLSAASGVVACIAQHSQGAMANLERAGTGLRAGNALISYVTYIVKMVYPSGLAVLYPYPKTVPLWEVIGSAVALAIVTMLALQAARTRPYLAVGWLWYLVSLLPVIGLVQVGSQSMADRYTYVPLIGVFVMIAWGIPSLLRKGDREKGRIGDELPTPNSQRSTSKGKGSADPKSPNTEHRTPNTHTPILPHPLSIPLAVAAVVVVATLAACAWVQIGYWQDTETLFTRALDVTTDNHIGHTNLGVVYFQRGDLESAVDQFSQAVSIEPNHAPAQCALGTALMQMGNTNQAIPHLMKAVQLDGNLSDAHNSLGVLYTNQGRYKEALDQYELALRTDQYNPDTHFNIAAALAGLGRLPDAADQYAEALRLRPDDARTHNNLGIVLMRMGRRDEAISEFNEALRLDPNCADAQDNLVRAVRASK